MNSVESTISQNLRNIERAGFALSYNGDLIKIYSQQLDSETSLASVLEVIKLIYYDNQGDVLDVSLVGLDGSQRNLLMGISSDINEALAGEYDFKNEKGTDRRFIFFEPGSPYRDSYYIYVAPLFDLTFGESEVDKKLATIVFIGELSTLKRSLNAVDPATAVIWINDENGVPLLSNTPQISSEDYASMFSKAEIAAQNTILGTKLSVAGVLINQSSLEGQHVVNYLLFTTFIFLVALLITFLFVRGKISIPMNRLRTDIEQVRQQGLSKRVQVVGEDEINQIAIWINSMLANLESATEQNTKTQQRLYEIELLNKQAELYSLRNQINPHFLSNTLQCMRGIAIENNVVEVADMATALYEIFLYSMKGRNRTTFEKELYFAQQYLHIFETRFQGNFEYTMDVDDEVMELTILKMTLQPVIENSIQHGFLDHQGKMRIAIRVFQENEMVIIYISDNGSGISPERLQEIQTILDQDDAGILEMPQNRPYGLGNINRRMKLIFGEEYRLEIRSLVPGTEVKIIIPAIEYQAIPAN
ncbi:MAG: histidine kinase [Anaerolineales bacterium]|nr:histidine kinase [Anaerolineales bacterium]